MEENTAAAILVVVGVWFNLWMRDIVRSPLAMVRSIPSLFKTDLQLARDELELLQVQAAIHELRR